MLMLFIALMSQADTTFDACAKRGWSVIEGQCCSSSHGFAEIECEPLGEASLPSSQPSDSLPAAPPPPETQSAEQRPQRYDAQSRSSGNACEAPFENMNQACYILGLTATTRPLCLVAWQRCVQACGEEICDKGRVLLNSYEFTKKGGSNNYDQNGGTYSTEAPHHGFAPQKSRKKRGQGMDGEGSQGSQPPSKSARLAFHRDFSASSRDGVDEKPNQTIENKALSGKIVGASKEPVSVLTGDYYSGGSRVYRHVNSEDPYTSQQALPKGHLGKYPLAPEITGPTEMDLFEKVSVRYISLSWSFMP